MHLAEQLVMMVFIAMGKLIVLVGVGSQYLYLFQPHYIFGIY
jgi:low temperature requirement protein LtrA